MNTELRPIGDIDVREEDTLASVLSADAESNSRLSQEVNALVRFLSIVRAQPRSITS